MWNPGIARENRKARRNAAKYNREIKDWSGLKSTEYATKGNPTINLGINQFKRLNGWKVGTVIRAFKQEAWAKFKTNK